MKLVSIVVPMYNEEEMAPIFLKEVSAVMSSLKDYNFEIVAVNDGSKDNTLDILKSSLKDYPNLVIVNLSRNFGHESALHAGLINARGDAVIPMDADLQDPPSLIIELIKKWEEGYDVVNAKRKSRDEDTRFKRGTAGLFYKLINKLSPKVKIPENVANFRLIDRKALDVVLSLSEKSRVFRVEVPFVGFRVGEVLFSRPKRDKGYSKYNTKAMVNLAIDSTISLTNRPLEWCISWTVTMGIITVLSIISEIVIAILLAVDVLSFSWMYMLIWLIINIVLIVGCVIMVQLSIMSLYLAKNIVETRNRPDVIVKEVIRKE